MFDKQWKWNSDLSWFSLPIRNISAILTPHEGSCGSNICNNTQTIYGPAGAPQPVKLNGFSAVSSKQVVSLNWNTEFEIDSKEFIVERAEGTEFCSVGTINSNGNSSTKKAIHLMIKMKILVLLIIV